MTQKQSNPTLEEQIVALLSRRDKEGITLLYRHYAGALFGIISRMIPEREVAEEVLQDVYLKVWEHADKYDPAKGRLFTWLAQIARRTAIDKVRSGGYRNQQKTGEIDSTVFTIASLREHPKLEDAGLRRMVERLDDKYRILIEYVYFKGFTQSELAEELSLPLGTVKTRIRAAISELRKVLGDEKLLLYLLLLLNN